MILVNLLDLWTEQKVEYILAGGQACVLYGVPRMTFDIDLLLNLTQENLERFVKVLDPYGYRPKIPISLLDLKDKDLVSSWISQKNMKALNLSSEANPEIDVLLDVPVTYESAKLNCEYKSFRSIKIPLLGLDDLILCKKVAGRPQDLSDLKALELIKYRRWKDE
ncbi:MAG TPA: DUF6036 family nucleotidyltransferase [Candidatus Nanoarchaeia archaeon]|nr:DUF6036 family nucleotidyltransferase [Candidatus Nanoarchaeia archaeon]